MHTTPTASRTRIRLLSAIPVRRRGKPACPPTRTGPRPAGVDLQQDSGQHDRSRSAQAMMTALSRSQCQQRASLGSTSPMCRCEGWTKASSTSAWITTSPARTPLFARFSYDQATIVRPRRFAGICRAQCLRQHADITNHGRNVGDLRNPHLLRSHTSISSASASTGFSTTSSRSATAPAKPRTSGFRARTWTAAAAGRAAGTVAVDQGLHELRADHHQLMGSYWALGDRGFAPFQGGTNVFSISDSLDMIRGKHNIRVGGQIRAQQMNVRDQRLPGRLLASTFGSLRGDAAADLLAGPDRLAHSRSDVQGRHHRPSLEDVPSLRSGRLAGNQQPDRESWTGLGACHSDHRSPEPPGELRFCSGNFCGRPAAIAGCADLRPNSDGRVGHRDGQDRARTAHRVRLEAVRKSRTPRFAAAMPSSTIPRGIRARRDLWENPPYFAESDNFSGCGLPVRQCTSATAELRPVSASSCRSSLQPNRPPATFPGNRSVAESRLQAGHGCSSST